MNHETGSPNPEKEYFTAHEAHYGSRDLGKALDIYVGLIANHPDTAQAGYSRSQIQNIVKSVVPKQDILDAEVMLIRNHLPAAPLLAAKT